MSSHAASARSLAVVDLAVPDTHAGDGVVWSLPHGGDLDANLVHLQPGGRIDEHVNSDVDVAVTAVAGHGELRVDGVEHALAAGVFAVVPKHTRRAIVAGTAGLTYLSIHARRGPLRIGAKPGSGHAR